MKTRSIITTFILMLALSGCDKHTFSLKDFLEEESDQYGLIVRGERELLYDDLTHQTGYKELADGKYEYRVYEDNMADYMVLTCDKMPEIGRTINCRLLYTTVDNVVTRNGDFEVVNIDGGKIWLWSEKYRIGVIVKEIHI